MPSGLACAEDMNVPDAGAAGSVPEPCARTIPRVCVLIAAQSDGDKLRGGKAPLSDADSFLAILGARANAAPPFTIPEAKPRAGPPGLQPVFHDRIISPQGSLLHGPKRNGLRG